MRSYVRYLAAASAASLLVFAACGGETAAPASPDLSSGSLNYTITPNQVSWTRLPSGPMPVDTRTVLIGGLIAVGGYPQFGAMQYTGATDWLEMTTVPDLSRSPLAWRFVFKLKPKAATLPIGRYTATIPVNVPAARNNPQSIVVVFNHCDNCLFVGDQRDAQLSGGDASWDASSTYNNTGSYRYDDYRVFVPPVSTVQVDMYGGCANGGGSTGSTYGSIWDVYLYAFTPAPAFVSVTSDDDAGCGYDSIILLTNATGTLKEYLVRATSYSSGTTGTYRIRVSNFNPTLRTRESEPGDKPTLDRK